MELSSSRITSFQQKILSWYASHQRDLPWRKTRDPYHILVSEIMLQQTQVERVIPKYEAWVERFPTVEDLAEASVRDVFTFWSGLGYNRRALNLQKSAQIITKESQGLFPHTKEELIGLPGIGEYTASAVVCFAFDQQIPVIDTNIRKVIAYEFFNGELPNEKTLVEVAGEILPMGQAYEWNQALMDYSRLVLKDKKIPVAKQSHFKSSDRYYRGQIVKVLLQVHQISFSGLSDYFNDHNPVDPSRLEEILQKMEKDGMIERINQVMRLPDV